MSGPNSTALLAALRDECAKMAEGYVYGAAAARAIRTINVDAVVRKHLAASASPTPAPQAERPPFTPPPRHECDWTRLKANEPCPVCGDSIPF